MDHLQASSITASHASVVEAHKLLDRFGNRKVVQIDGSIFGHGSTFTLSDQPQDSGQWSVDSGQGSENRWSGF
jgi:hypothetical protein